MPAVDGVGALQKAMLAALDQMGTAIGSMLEASPSLVFLHQVPGYGVEPKNYADPWQPGGDVYSMMAAGTPISTPTVNMPPAPAPGAGSPTKKPQPLPPPDPHATASVLAAVNTAHLANPNLELGTSQAIHLPGTVADAWEIVGPAVSINTPLPVVPQDRLDAIKRVQSILYVRKGVPTEGYRDWREARARVTGLIGQKQAAFFAAMGDPVLAASWPLGEGPVWDQRIQDAASDRDAIDQSTGDMSYSQADQYNRDFGVDAIGAAVDAVHNRWGLFGQASGVVGKFAYTRIEPRTWCMSTADDFGAMSISVSDSTYDAAASQSFSDFSSSYYSSTSQSDSGGVGIVYGPYSATGDIGFSDASSRGGFSSGSNAGSTSWDHSSSASVSGSFFLASIDRPWLFDQIFNVRSGWHVEGLPAQCLSDGSNTRQNSKNLVHALPIQMLVARNITISCNDWGHFSSFASSFSQSSESHSASTATSYGGSVGAFGLGGKYHHDDSSTDGSQFSQDDGSSGWSFQSDESGGTLSIHGTQILGWVAQVVPASPPS